ncbi:hypothetical protein T11_12930 [Trichinella zimbabwensis]|uniref:Uncharacterized protein n=2 Tax=Trichinella TaxID=6333 RepID=A0A0V1MY56_9BILA|nr:hypothetical protein T11_12930 [Trichinella zimbabwensis]KRZ76699.1 hypothetical protein T10_10651 [Trichinella papuae]
MNGTKFFTFQNVVQLILSTYIAVTFYWCTVKTTKTIDHQLFKMAEIICIDQLEKTANTSTVGFLSFDSHFRIG